VGQLLRGGQADNPTADNDDIEGIGFCEVVVAN
jgi:hypothetical protein